MGYGCFLGCFAPQKTPITAPFSTKLSSNDNFIIEEDDKTMGFVLLRRKESPLMEVFTCNPWRVTIFLGLFSHFTKMDNRCPSFN
jgi:hypothetical protein